jgi:hypothetical protein
MKKSIKSLLAAGPIALQQSDFTGLLTPKTGVTTDPKVITLNVINYLLFFLGILAVGAIVYGGILFITSGGDSEKTTRARNTLLYAIIGVIIIVLAFAIVNWAKGFLAS